MASYDVIVIGSGPGGYVAAIRCAQLGLKTACVEGRETLGGTCLNVGCIPSKALLHASHMLHEAEHNFAAMGLKGKSPSVDWKQMLSYKDDTIGQNTKGIEFLFKKNKIDWLKGWGSIPEAGKVKVGDDTHEAKNIIIATGSEVSTLPGVEIDEKTVVSSTGALELPKVPKKLVVIGAGVIGLELGSVYSRLGSEVTVVEYLDHVTPGMDGEVQKNFHKLLKKQGLNFIMGAAVQGVEAMKTKAKVTYKLRKDDSEETLDADVVLVATGRKPFTDGLGLDSLGVEMTERGQIKTDDHWQTNVKGVYAIGDCISGPMLAHKAEDEGVAVADEIAGKHGHVNYGVIPGVIYTTPEVASVGAIEQTLKAEGRAYKVGKFPFTHSSKAMIAGHQEGLVKIVSDAKYDEVLGVHIIGPKATELIAEAVVGMTLETTTEEMFRAIHPHPTLSEMMHESVLGAYGRALHI